MIKVQDKKNKSKHKRKNKKSAYETVLGALNLIGLLCGVSNFNLFILFITVFVELGIYLSERKKYTKKLNRLFRKKGNRVFLLDIIEFVSGTVGIFNESVDLESAEERKEEYKREKREWVRNCNKKESEIRKDIKHLNKRFAIVFLVIVFVTMINFRQPICSMAIEVLSFVRDSEESIRPVEGTKPQTDTENASEQTIQFNMHFYLDDLNEIKDIEYEDDKKYFFTGERNDIKFTENVKKHLEHILSLDYPDTYNGCLTIIEENYISKAAEKEEDFDKSIEAVQRYAAEQNYFMWKEFLKHSSDFNNEVIVPRLKLVEAGKCNAVIAFLIANDYQLLADEHKRQGGNYNTVLYYYIKSIIWTEKALSYCSEKKEQYFSYLKSRYRDIKDTEIFCEKCYEYWNFAKKVYDAMEIENYFSE